MATVWFMFELKSWCGMTPPGAGYPWVVEACQMYPFEKPENCTKLWMNLAIMNTSSSEKEPLTKRWVWIIYYYKEFFKNSAVILSSDRILTGKDYEYQRNCYFCCNFSLLFFNFSGQNLDSGEDISKILQQFWLDFWLELPYQKTLMLLMIHSIFPYYFLLHSSEKWYWWWRK